MEVARHRHFAIHRVPQRVKIEQTARRATGKAHRGRLAAAFRAAAIELYDPAYCDVILRRYEATTEIARKKLFQRLAQIRARMDATDSVGWLTAHGSPQRQAALTLARQTINQGLPALGRWGGGQAASWLGGLLPQQEYEWESEFEISPIRRIYPDAMMEHLARRQPKLKARPKPRAWRRQWFR
jgi:hypothetical protein